ncbi:PREDICTED: uncharacterized protein LOC105570660 [Vollenhovia emeryi]|uniref:uncharacterized protein LOC105570660 n=1 Tax=Vollenhovia emeryi TaxID=411798 RepID=UPI0005F43B63|nr:PREDICTED: uncharacterized protein LOC105570660 [Vollenhovia emeryi]
MKCQLLHFPARNPQDPPRHQALPHHQRQDVNHTTTPPLARPASTTTNAENIPEDQSLPSTSTFVPATRASGNSGVSYSSWRLIKIEFEKSARDPRIGKGVRILEKGIQPDSAPKRIMKSTSTQTTPEKLLTACPQTINTPSLTCISP